MIDQSSIPHWISLKATLTKWRIAFLVFALAYMVILLLNLTNMPMQWDEVVHLNGGLTLNAGLYSKYISTAFYPPLYDAVTAVSFQALGPSLFSARLISALFSVLSLGAVFELAYSLYNGKTALLAAVGDGHQFVHIGDVQRITAQRLIALREYRCLADERSEVRAPLLDADKLVAAPVDGGDRNRRHLKEFRDHRDDVVLVYRVVDGRSARRNRPARWVSCCTSCSSRAR